MTVEIRFDIGLNSMDTLCSAVLNRLRQQGGAVSGDVAWDKLSRNSI